MATPLQIQDFERRCDALRARLNDADFLANKGLGNEAGIFLFCYDATLEAEARDYFQNLIDDAGLGKLGAGEVRANIIRHNLYDILLSVCEREEIMEAAFEMELEDGPEELLDTLKSIASVDEYVDAMSYAPHEAGDVILITGVGEVYPFMRVHNVLNSMQSEFRDVPVVVAYPGTFDGGSLSLFGKLKDVRHFGQLRRCIGNISESTLSKQLKELVDDGFLVRTDFGEVPPRVEYTLTEQGESFIPILLAMKQWGEEELGL